MISIRGITIAIYSDVFLSILKVKISNEGNELMPLFKINFTDT